VLLGRGPSPIKRDIILLNSRRRMREGTFTLCFVIPGRLFLFNTLVPSLVRDWRDSAGGREGTS